MRKLLLVLFLVAAASFGFVNRSVVINKPLIFNTDFDQYFVQKLWNDIRTLDRLLPRNEKITLYLNSYGGESQTTTILLERIARLQRRGRVFVGVVYGNCFSSCGSLFGAMNKRYMTVNAIYMQHASTTEYVTPTTRLISDLIDIHRLKYDSSILRKDAKTLIAIFKSMDFVSSAKVMLRDKMIDGIVEQPDIDDI